MGKSKHCSEQTQAHEYTPKDRREGYKPLTGLVDASRLACVEVLPDETGVTASGFLERAIARYRARKITVERVMSDNGAPYVSEAFRSLLSE
jgi:hypothetical protein